MGRKARRRRYRKQSDSSTRSRERAADSRLRARFKIIPESRGGSPGFAGILEYERRLALQGGVCAICKCPPDPSKRFAVDHNHSSQLIRGLLCPVCNGRILGRLERFKKRISIADIVQYLEKFDPENVLLRAAKE